VTVTRDYGHGHLHTTAHSEKERDAEMRRLWAELDDPESRLLSFTITR
jgi:hypothetical protein